MAERRDGGRGVTEPETSERVPTPEESWARHTRVLDLVEQIRRARDRRGREPERGATRR
jgi:hypothetical protein